MLTFAQFVEEISRDQITLSPAEVRRMRNRFGDKTLQMGHLEADGSMRVPMDCILEAARSLGAGALSEAAKTLRNDQVSSMLESAEVLVERVSEARRRKLERMVQSFQAEQDDVEAHRQWAEIEEMIFGVRYRD